MRCIVQPNELHCETVTDYRQPTEPAASCDIWNAGKHRKLQRQNVECKSIYDMYRAFNEGLNETPSE